MPTRPATPWNAPELMGFLGVRRGHLAIGAALASFLFIGSYDVQASAAQLAPVEQEEVVVPGAQELQVSSQAQAQSIERDAIDVESYTPVMWPLDPTTKISSYFGFRSCAGCSSDHQGVDYNPGFGHPIVAIADGVVSETGNPSGALGVHVTVEHRIEGSAQTVKSVYAHMELGSMNLAIGDRVERGQLLGLVGNTGMSTGPHLHFGILLDDEAVEPLGWMRANVTEPWVDAG
ncbi:M23 family metallopeptidase [Homoserinibacter sp. YIM 151385]|uniref:M23 family metallopeptidase n=1 Tax=Homoserinibacter sp. YIM 151385 TaxID=2985506 RepID=UPI0022F06B9F|nr:M23 family metallopeptidase [Homoserinibacter sp. YIM 151385]WBU39070.1 M23 family metallopeptidase [Homoserinibacter sp. YIM 151385]